MKIKNKENLILFIPLIILNIISLLNMINAKLISNSYNNIFYKQLIWFILGYLLIFIISKLKIKKLFIYSKYLYIFSCFLLILVLFLGTNINGAKCWFNLFGISFQPSEFTKLAMSLYMFYIVNNTKVNSFKDEIKLILKLFIIFIIPSILVFLEPDTGAIINFLIIFIITLFYSKLNKWWYILFFITLFSFITIIFIMYFNYQDTLIKLIGTSLFYRMDRLINFANGNSYQLENALISIGATNYLGVGLNKILLYIPEAPTDFIFAFSCGNFGLISGILILISFLIIDIYLIIISYIKKNISLFINIYLSLFLFNQIYNILMNIGLLPIMGIPLPFLSYGGSNNLINFIFLGIILKKKC